MTLKTREGNGYFLRQVPKETGNEKQPSFQKQGLVELVSNRLQSLGVFEKVCTAAASTWIAPCSNGC